MMVTVSAISALGIIDNGNSDELKVMQGMLGGHLVVRFTQIRTRHIVRNEYVLA